VTATSTSSRVNSAESAAAAPAAASSAGFRYEDDWDEADTPAADAPAADAAAADAAPAVEKKKKARTPRYSPCRRFDVILSILLL
jgi:hypothetical protein